MAETGTSPPATPKRKRDHLAAELRVSVSSTPHRFAKSIFSFQPPDLLPPRDSNGLLEDGNSSPRSKVADRFRDLAIMGGREALETKVSLNRVPESGGGAATVAATGNAGGPHRIDTGRPILAPEMRRFDFDAGAVSTEVDMQMHSEDEDTASPRKRPKVLGPDTVTVAPASAPADGETAVPTTEDDPIGDKTITSTQSSTTLGPLDGIDQVEADRTQNSVAGRTANPKSRNRKRTGTPPVSSKKKTAASREDDKTEIVIVDPVRAALTWREDEITVYDPEDQDDDGTGINGIGFKPTAAVAYRRAQKRRQQLAEYKKREESEARAGRNKRRRGGSVEMSKKHSMVRVHFSDAPPTTVMTT
ncbi:hypothetical protein F5Y17DRAFT_348580 [Xylariaceae sp. FL0594]|nr:hypothetical protein F5Y17DRAFT_348580 [Xylariaceae sp. FL0594]